MMLLLCVSFSYTYAWDEGEVYEKKESTNMEDRDVIYYNHWLELEFDDGEVEAEWDDFTLDGFDWYKLVYSATNSQPVYPDDKTVFVGSVDQRETTFKLDSRSSNHYVRLCAVVLNDDYSKDRYCGRVQKLITTPEDFEDDSYEEKYEKEEYKKNSEEKLRAKKQELQKRLEEKQKLASEKKEYVSKKVTEKKAILSEKMKQRIDTVIENFVEKLEDKGYSDAQMASAINTVISRLWEFRNKAGYQEIVKYMVSVLEEYREEYSNPLEDLESIFEGL